MNTTKTVLLAALTALSLGMGSAMAQSEVPAGAGNEVGGHQAAPRIVSTRVQAGTSDMGTVRSGGHILPFNGDFSDLANPG
jgi:hypothetical protein